MAILGPNLNIIEDFEYRKAISAQILMIKCNFECKKSVLYPNLKEQLLTIFVTNWQDFQRNRELD